MWKRMKQLLQGRFLSPDYQQTLYNNLNIVRTVTTYMKELYRLASRCDLVMTEEQQVTKYISGLKYSIQECVILHDAFSVDEAHNKTSKVERLQSRAHLSGTQLHLKSQQVAQEFS